jgi:hypothetical protein
MNNTKIDTKNDVLSQYKSLVQSGFSEKQATALVRLAEQKQLDDLKSSALPVNQVKNQMPNNMQKLFSKAIVMSGLGMAFFIGNSMPHFFY